MGQQQLGKIPKKEKYTTRWKNIPIKFRVTISKTNGFMIQLDITMKHEHQLRGSKQETTTKNTECMKLKGRNRKGENPLGQGIYMMHRVL